MTLHSLVPGYVPLADRAVWSRRFFYVNALLGLVAIASGFMQLNLFSHIADGTVTTEELTRNDMRQWIITLAQLVLTLATAIPFLRWFHRATMNLPALEAPSAYTPNEAVAGFFIPVVNLMRPCRAMREIWAGSRPVAAGKDGPTSDVASPVGFAVVDLWWVLFVFAGLANHLASRVVRRVDTLDGYRAGTWILIASDVMVVTGALLAAYLVVRITNGQERRHAGLGSPDSPA